MVPQEIPDIKPAIRRKCKQFAKKACEKMNEPNKAGVTRLAYLTGPLKAIELVKQAIEKQASDTPILRKDGTPKTVGGAYFYLSISYLRAEKPEEYAKYRHWTHGWHIKEQHK